jgi:ceramide glucosyltransferase
MKMDVGTIVGSIFLILACAGAAYALAAGLLVSRFFSVGQRDRVADRAPGVTILKPLCGAAPGLGAQLMTFCCQNYPGDIQIVFGVQAASDPVIRIVDEIKQRFSTLDLALVIDTRSRGTNRKISNILNMMSAAKHDVLILADSDIAVDPNYVETVVAALAADNVGAVTCLYSGRAAAGIWSRLAAMAIDHHFFPSVVVGLRLGLATPCFGSTIALRRSFLDQIGGFERFADHLADDYEIGRAVRDARYRVAIPAMVVTHACVERSFSELLDHELRWARTIRMVDPVGFAGSGITHALPFALLGVALLGATPLSIAVLAGAVIVRLWLAVRIDAMIGVERSPPALILVRDVLSFYVYLAAFTARSVTWSGRRYRIGPKRTITLAEKH